MYIVSCQCGNGKEREGWGGGLRREESWGGEAGFIWTLTVTRERDRSIHPGACFPAVHFLPSHPPLLWYDKSSIGRTEDWKHPALCGQACHRGLPMLLFNECRHKRQMFSVSSCCVCCYFGDGGGTTPHTHTHILLTSPSGSFWPDRQFWSQVPEQLVVSILQCYAFECVLYHQSKDDDLH